MKKAYMTCIDERMNHNKYYEMVQISDDEFVVFFGRIGTKPQERHYPMNRWKEKRKEKLGKGYVAAKKPKAC